MIEALIGVRAEGWSDCSDRFTTPAVELEPNLTKPGAGRTTKCAHFACLGSDLDQIAESRSTTSRFLN